MAPSDVKFAYEMVIRATPSRVWQAITDGDMTAKYSLGARIQSTWRPGDDLSFVAEDGSLMSAGTVVEVDPGRRLVYRARLLYDPALAGDAPIRLTWEIQALGEQCRVVLTHDDFDGETATYRAVVGGVPTLMSSIKSLLETGRALALPT